jgi:hypothetical protein
MIIVSVIKKCYSDWTRTFVDRWTECIKSHSDYVQNWDMSNYCAIILQELDPESDVGGSLSSWQGHPSR